MKVAHSVLNTEMRSDLLNRSENRNWLYSMPSPRACPV